jgi:hypothetical protein
MSNSFLNELYSKYGMEKKSKQWKFKKREQRSRENSRKGERLLIDKFLFKMSRFRGNIARRF